MSEPSASSRRKRRLHAEMNVVPYIDVMLVLLVIFMVTAPLLNQGVEIDLPDSPVNEAVDTEGAFILVVNAAGRMSVSIGDVEESNLDAGQVYALARGYVRKNPGKAAFVKGDESASYRHIMEALNTLRDAGIKNYSLVTEPGAPRR